MMPSSFRRSPVFVLVLALSALLIGLAAGPAAAQERATTTADTTTADTARTADRPALTLEDIHASSRFQPKSFRGGRWAAEGPVVTYIEAKSDTGATHLMRYNLETDERTRLIDGSDLYAEDVGRLIHIEGYAYSEDESKVLIYTDSEEVWRYNTKGYYYVYDLGEQTLASIAPREKGFQMFAKFNPAGDRVAFVRDRNLFMVDVPSMQETQLTSDGADGTIINGTFDWVYEEEFGLRDGFAWGPQGRYLSFFKLDESGTRDFQMTDFRTRYPSYETFRYPKAGEQNSEVQVGVIDLDTTEAGQPATTFFDTNTWKAGGDSTEYIARMGWTPPVDGQARVWMYRMNRDQNTLDLLYGNPTDASLDTVLTEEEDTYIDIEDEKLTFLDDGERFVWASEASGSNHLYLYGLTGDRLRQVTRGDYEVTAFHGVDEEEEVAYVTTTAASGRGRQLYRVPLADSAGTPQQITEQPGWHSINLSKSRAYYIDTYSNNTTPPVVTLHRADGEQLAVLESNEELIERLERYDLPASEFTEVPAADGTMLNAYVVRPRGFDESQRYPLLMYVYGGPGAQTVTNRWGGARELWHRYLASEMGVMVASVDNRGTGGRGKAFQDVPYQQLGVPEAKDQIAAGEHFAELPYVDERRVGIWGWSYGGFMTLRALLTGDGPDTFKAGLSVAPVTNWKNYDTIYTERYMSTPQKNPTGYRLGSPVNYAERLKADQNLLLVHGDFDDNVHLQNTIQMADTLQAVNKQFDLMLYPGRDHGIYGGKTRLHLFTLLTDFVEEKLIATEPESLTTR